MKSTLRLRPEAEADLKEAYRWHEKQRRGLGDDFLLYVEAALSALQENPKQFAFVYKEVRRTLVRRFPYTIFYVAQREGIMVLAIFHARRNPKIWQNRVGKKAD